VKTRAIADADLEAALKVLIEDEEAIFDRPSRLELSDLRQWLSLSDRSKDTWLHEGGEGVDALGWVTPWGDALAAVGVVHPRAKGRGLGAQLIDTSEARGREGGFKRMQQIALGADGRAAELIRAHGYDEVRRFYEMAIHLDAPPVVPGDIAIEQFRKDDGREFHDALEEAFGDHWGHHARTFEEWWQQHGSSESFDPTLWFLVRDGDQIVAAIRNEANRNGGGYVGSLGVRRAFRGRGLARALLLRTFAAFYARGVPRVTLGVDAANPTGATRLYESAGMEVEMENVVYEKELS
jgi:mycothiol synthase